MDKLVGLITKEELLKQAAPFEQVNTVDITLGKDVSFAEDITTLKYNGEIRILDQAALEALTSRIGIPRTYLRKLPRERLAMILPHLEYWYREQLGSQKMRLFTIGDRIVMISPKTNTPYVKISEIADAVEKQLGKENIIGFHKPYLTDWNRIEFSVVTPEVIEIKKEDPLNSGIRIEHSLLGERPSKLASYVFRQICSNGNITVDDIESWSWSRGSSDEFNLWIQKSIREARLSFGNEVERLKKLSEIPTDGHINEILTAVLSESHVPQKLQTEVKGNFIDKEVKNLYDVYNIFTERESHSDFFEKHPSSRGLLGKIAAGISFNSRFCPVCGSHRK